MLADGRGWSVQVGIDEGNLHAVDADSGEGVWHFGIGDWVRSSPTVADGTAYVGNDDGVHAVDIATGEQERQIETDD
jgi:outer membrane protein assembly factor BamB